MNKLSNLLDFSEDPDKYHGLYAAFLEKAILTEEDRESLKAERGFTDEIIDECGYKSCRPENADIINSLKEDFSEEKLFEVGLLENKDYGLVPNSQLLHKNILIPYTNMENKYVAIRPHKLGFKDRQINLYVPRKHVGGELTTWVITESEFKAAAAVQFGYPAIGVPGIHSFLKNHFPRLRNFIEENNINNIVIVFDNEVKNDPKFHKKYKPDATKQWDTQWATIKLCKKIQEEVPGVMCKIGVLPASWMEEGKIDIDGALAQGRTSSEFRSVIVGSVEWETYRADLPQVAQLIISKKLIREEHLKETLVSKEYNRYVINKPKKENGETVYIPTIVSNFTLEIVKQLIDDNDTFIREVVFTGEDGVKSKPFTWSSKTVDVKAFKAWVVSCGNYYFLGDGKDLDYIWEHEIKVSDGKTVKSPSSIGLIKNEAERFWLYKNVLIKKDGSYILLDEKSGVVWNGLTGYRPESINSITSGSEDIPALNLPPRSGDPTDKSEHFTLMDIKGVVDDMCKIYNSPGIKIAVGWIISCLFSEEIHKKFGFFPLLFIGGQKESGKTTLGNWLMAMVGFKDVAARQISTQAGMERGISWYSSLPYWMDEYRNKDASTLGPFFRSIYQRQSLEKGTTTSKTRSYSVNAGIVLSGEEAPQDSALLSRCVIIPLTKNKSKDNASLYRNIEDLRSKNLLSRLAFYVLNNQGDFAKQLDLISSWKDKMRSEDSSLKDRVASNYAIAGCFYDMVFLKNASPKERRDFFYELIEAASAAEKEKEDENILNHFMEDLITFHEDLEGFYKIDYDLLADKGKRRIALHFKTFYTKWAEHRQRTRSETFKQNAILQYIKEESYFVKSNTVLRIDGKQQRCLILSLDEKDNPPEGLLYLADIADPDKEGYEEDTPKTSQDLFGEI